MYFYSYICIMDMKEFLKKNPIINLTQLAIKMWGVPADDKGKIKTERTRLDQKINNINRQNMREEDYKEVFRVLDELNEDLKKLKKSQKQ